MRRINQIRKKIANENKAFRLIISSCIIAAIIFLILPQTNLSGEQRDDFILRPQIKSSAQEYSFAELGIFIEPLYWVGNGQFIISINKTFDIENSGPAFLILEFSCDGDKPESPGYEIIGSFNQIYFASIISRPIIPSKENIVRSISIPLSAQGRIYGNNLCFNISCYNEFSGSNDGILTIRETSKLIVGDTLLIESYGNYFGSTYPDELCGTTSLGGIKVESYVQLTIENETLVQSAEYQMQLELHLEGDVSVSAVIYDESDNVGVFSKNETSATSLVVTSLFQPIKGVNYCKIEISVYGGSIWTTPFNITITSCQISLEESQGYGFGFGDLEIPFFQWPSIPIVGVIVLLLWAMPYSILKYREWKKLPDEVDLNIIDDEEELNILDPEGLTTTDDDDDIDDTYETWDDD